MRNFRVIRPAVQQPVPKKKLMGGCTPLHWRGLTRGVNRRPKIVDLRKCPNPIRTLVGHLIFSWAIFGQAISHGKFHALFHPCGIMEHNSRNDITLCVSLCTSVTQACREQFINVMSNDKYLDNLWTPKHFGYFLDNIFG